MRTILLGLLVMAANPTPATPSVSSTDTVSISASQEALLLRQYTQVVANDHRVAYPAIENNTGGITLTQIIGEPRQVPGATQDPREFGFDPQQPWRPVRPPRANRISSLRGQPGDSSRRASPPSPGSGEVNIGGQVRRYFTHVARAIYTDKEAAVGGLSGSSADFSSDPLSMALGPSLTVTNSSLNDTRSPRASGSLGGGNAASVNLVRSLDVDSRDALQGPDARRGRDDIVAGLGTLVRSNRQKGRTNNSGGGRDDVVSYTESEAVSIREFAYRVTAAIFTTPWLYLGLGVFAFTRVLAAGMRR